MLELGSNIPRKGNRFTAALGCWLLKLLGWKFEGDIPNESKMVIAVAPHSSNLDFVVAMAAVFSVRLHVSYMAKHSLFKFPLKSFLLRTGGIPVNRNASQGLIEQMVEQFAEQPQLILGLAPEGTRKKVKKWKKGFALIAKEANVPVLPALLDYKTKTIRFESLIRDVTDPDKTLTQMQVYTSTAIPKNLN